MRGELSDWNGKLTRSDTDMMNWERKVVLGATRVVAEYITLEEQTGSDVPDPDQDVEAVLYIAGDKLICRFDNGGTMRWFSIDLTATGAQQVAHATSEP